MSVLVLQSAPPVTVRATWAQVGPALWVASRRGEFVGTVEQVGQAFVACDGYAAQLGTFSDLETAKHRVLQPAEVFGGARRARVDDMTLAWATAIVGGAVILGSLAMLTLGLGA